VPHRDPHDPSRRRANRGRGHGTFAQSRPPIAGAAGRQSGRVLPEVVGTVDRETLQGFAATATRPGAAVYTDELTGYRRRPEAGRARAAVYHAPGRREWARGGDGGGVRVEVHNNTLDGAWTGLRNDSRPFRGVSKRPLHTYVAIFSRAHNIKAVLSEFVRAACSLWPTTANTT
jgi:hypothetical protein